MARGDESEARARSAFGGRYEQAFPTLSADEIDRLRRFGELRRYADGARLFETGKPGLGMFVLLSGHVAISQRDGLGHVSPLIDQGPGQFLAEVGTLSGRPALVDGEAEGEVEAILIPPEGLRRLLIAEAELGERITRALILRRVNLIQSGAGGPVIVGSPLSGAVARLQNFLGRNGMPHHLIDPGSDPEAAELVARFAPDPSDLPLVVTPDGTILRNPSEHALARAAGMLSVTARRAFYDVAVIGSGPAGLATAVYAASEGLDVIVIDFRSYGGQAGASARIENYLGFPTGISGQALAGRAFVQAQKFGAEMLIPAEVAALDCRRQDGAFALEIADDGTVRARTVVIASGARYRRPAIANLDAFEGRGVWYWASPIEAQLCAGEEVFLVGGGNSAGQAAVFLSGHARKVSVMVRGRGLADSMSRYLIDRLGASPRIEVLTHTEIVALGGPAEGALDHATILDRQTGETRVAPVRNIFLFAGAEPATGWLAGCGVDLDKAGFVVTGVPDADGRRLGPLASSVPGVFAVGDVRSGSVKRVGGAIGEGAQVVAAIHAFLADAPVTAA